MKFLRTTTALLIASLFTPVALAQDSWVSVRCYMDPFILPDPFSFPVLPQEHGDLWFIAYDGEQVYVNGNKVAFTTTDEQQITFRYVDAFKIKKENPFYKLIFDMYGIKETEMPKELEPIFSLYEKRYVMVNFDDKTAWLFNENDPENSTEVFCE